MKKKNTEGNPSFLSAIAEVTVIIETLMSIRNCQRLSMIRGLGEIDKDSSTVQAREREIGQVCPRDRSSIGQKRSRSSTRHEG